MHRIRGFINTVIRFLTGSSGSRKSKIRLLSVGVENGKYGACPGAAFDAKRINDRVKAGKKVLLLDRQATRSAVASALSDGVSMTDDDGLFIFFYSGHGGQIKSSDKTETDGKDETLCLYDGELVDNKIWSILQSAKCRVFIVTDCCNSGTNYRSAMPFNGLVASMATRCPRGIKLLHWGGCDDGKYSYGDEQGGVMTNMILKLVGDSLSYKDAFKKVLSASYKYQVPVKANIGFDEDVELFK